MSLSKRITQVTILPQGANIYNEGVIVLTVDDQAGGEFIRVMCCADDARPGEIAIDPDEWPMVRDALDEMFNSLRKDD